MKIYNPMNFLKQRNRLNRSFISVIFIIAFRMTFTLTQNVTSNQQINKFKPEFEFIY